MKIVNHAHQRTFSNSDKFRNIHAYKLGVVACRLLSKYYAWIGSEEATVEYEYEIIFNNKNNSLRILNYSLVG